MEVIILANIKSAKKRILTSAKNAERNKSVKSAVKTQIKKVEAAVSEGNKETAVKELSALKSEMNRAASKGIIKKETAARKISRTASAVDKL